VRKVIRGQRSDVFRTRESTLDPFLCVLDEEWSGGCRNGAELSRRLKTRGFAGSLRVVTEWATRRRRAERISDAQLRKIPSARTIARMLTHGRDHLNKAETMIVAMIEANVPALSEARGIINRFQEMIRTNTVADLDSWIEAAGESLVASFARGVTKDRNAVRAAIAGPWSNGQTEGQINRLKVVKRQMYGRAKIDLLEARLIGAM
jgi:transposase